MLIKCLLVIACAWRVTDGCRPSPPPPKQPPTIDCPTINGDYIAEQNTKSARVTWSTPKVSDPDGEDSKLRLSLKSGKASGDLFDQGTHSVTYVVTDTDGLTNFCTFSFIVKVKECTPVQSIRNGDQSCSGNIYGADCTFRCDEGYKLKGKKKIYCEKNEKWSGDLPQCVALECPKLKLPPHGKDHICTKERKYESICWLICDEENGYAPARGQWTQCKKDQTWTNIRMECIDVEPPVIHNCPADTVFQTKKPGSEKTIVVWPTITATDNSGKTIIVESPNTGVSPSKGTFLEGTDLVRFTAVDAEGNKAEPCFFIVNVQSVECDPPKFDDVNLDTPGCLDFQEGKSCKLECYLALTLKGNDYITCRKDENSGREAKGYWDWGQTDVPAAEKPYCQVHNCTELRSPKNGAMACDKWTLGAHCMLQCSEEYDIPMSESFSAALYICSQATGRWNTERVPDCTYREYGEKLRLPEQYYFYGSCSAAKLEIQENFLFAIDEIDACPKKDFCTVENVNVRCGDESEDDFPDEDFEDFRKRRSVRDRRLKCRTGKRRRYCRRRGGRRRRPKYRKKLVKNFISFNIVMPSDKEGKFSEVMTKYKGKLGAISERILNTPFKVGRRVIKVRRLETYTPLPICRPGLKIGFYHKDSCVPCLEGSYHNVKRDECDACPLGQFQENKGQLTCNHCPQGQTTLTIANINETACIDMCRPGHYSINGVVPCFKCHRGTYQASQNATSCKRCPVGMTTKESGATASSQCVPYDMLLQGPVDVPVEGNSPSQICDFTFAVWIKLVETNYGGIKFEIYSPITQVGLEVAISSSVKVYIGKNHHVQVASVIKSDWVHVAVVWTQQTVTIYIGGVPVQTQTLTAAPACPSPASSVMRMTIRDHAYMYLRDLNFLTEARGPDKVKALSTTCNSYLEKSLFTLEQMNMLTLSNVNEVIPSTCLRPDICSTRPCGKNVCIPRGDSFICACRGGYSGEKCEIPPDLCKDNICRNGATCIVSGANYKCKCRPGFRGLLCEDRIADGGWTKWMEWSECSTSCGKGTRLRHRFCTNPPPDREGKKCTGRKRQRRPCQQPACPQCTVSTLVVGEGIIPDCKKKGKSITCSVSCKLGKVFPEKPFNYTCNQGIWTPTRQTVSCTDPVTPLTAGINYTVVFDNTLNSHIQVKDKLDMVGNGFQCARSGGCNIVSDSSACSDLVEVCDNYDGDYYGSLIVEKPVPAGQINIRKIQENKRMREYLSPLFATWNVFTHTSEEERTPEHRALEISIQKNKLMVYPFEKPSLAVEVMGQFGTILKTWKYLDDTNWEVRNESYTDFDMTLGQRQLLPNFLSAVQIMTCPPGSVQGGVFCIKCPPGKMYENKQCSPCRHGFYQNEPGMSSCKPCPGFQTTELLGNPTKNQCIETKVSELKMLLGLSSPGFGVFDPHTQTYKTITLGMTAGNIDYLTYNQRDGFVYYATQNPTTIGRIRIDGRNEDILSQLPPGTLVTGLDVDVGADLLLYTTYTGVLAALHIHTGAEHILLSNLTKPRDLVLDQKFGVYWVESSSIKHLKYSSKVANTVIRDRYAVWRPILDKQDGKILWQSYGRLRTAYLNGSRDEILATHFTSRFGHTEDYYFHIDSDGRLIRVNKDLSALVSVYSLPRQVVRMWMVNTTDDINIDNLCSESRTDCDHGCFPVNQTSRQCFCADDHTLQKDYKTCRSDFSVLLQTSDPRSWSQPRPSDYSVPPSMTLRLKVQACHGARVALAENHRRLYHVDLGQKRGNVTEMSIKKISVDGPPIFLFRKEIDLLDCNSYKPFWITWKDKRLRVGEGEVVGKKEHMVAADYRPYTVNFIMFGTRLNATAEWQF